MTGPEPGGGGGGGVPPPAPVNAPVNWPVLSETPLQVGEAAPPLPPGQAWSRSTDQKASRPMPLLLAQLATDEASESVKVEPSSLTPIIGVIPTFAYEYEPLTALIWFKVFWAALMAALPISMLPW